MRTLAILLFAVITSLSVQAQQPLHIMTFNIRYNNPGDSLNAWPHRKDKAASQIRFHGAHIVGVQEALHGQLTDLQQQLTHYKYVGAGRDDGRQKGEYSAIFYDTTRLQMLQSETFWLSEQPTVPGSKGWDAAFPRVVTWARFKDRKTGKEFFHFNTHFDHIGKTARRESARLLLQKIADIAGKRTVILTGDFNATPDDEPIKIITDTTNPISFINSKEVSQQPHYGPTGTFNAFQNKELTDQPIDYIFIRKGTKVWQHATLSQTWQGRFSSDHFPVFAAVVL